MAWPWTDRTALYPLIYPRRNQQASKGMSFLTPGGIHTPFALCNNPKRICFLYHSRQQDDKVVKNIPVFVNGIDVNHDCSRHDQNLPFQHTSNGAPLLFAPTGASLY